MHAKKASRVLTSVGNPDHHARNASGIPSSNDLDSSGRVPGPALKYRGSHAPPNVSSWNYNKHYKPNQHQPSNEKSNGSSRSPHLAKAAQQKTGLGTPSKMSPRFASKHFLSS